MNIVCHIKFPMASTKRIFGPSFRTLALALPLIPLIILILITGGC